VAVEANTSLSKTDQAYVAIRERIINGTYGSGYRLVIDALARELEVSAVPVREAIRRLEAQGLVTFERNVGAQVALYDARHWRAAIEVVAVLEAYGTAQSAPHLRASDYKQARARTAEMREALESMDGVAASAANRAFHETIVARCPNLLLLAQTQEAWDRLDLIQSSGFRLMRYLPKRGWEALEEHDSLLTLIERDPTNGTQIERAARRHRERTICAYERDLSAGPRRSSRPRA
jgi:DNA-binding GntR family transcriptional regulator